jgi:hypothetical protein
MTRASYSGVSPDPSNLSTDSGFGAVQASEKAEGEVICLLTAELRVVRLDRQWCMQSLKGKTWTNVAFCATRDGLVLRVKDWLLKDRLSRLGDFQVKQMKLPDKTGVLKTKSVVTREMLAATDAARAALRRGDVASFGVDQTAWDAIAALPDYFKAQTE